MNGYDRDFGFGYNRGIPGRRGYGGYGADFRGGYDRDVGMGRPPFGGRGATGEPRDYGTEFQRMRRGGYDRGEYGSSYPAFGGYPGGSQRGMYYGRGYAGYDTGYGFAREPFMPETAYQRHPEYNRPQVERGSRWPERGHEFGGGRGTMNDTDVEQAVRETMYQDRWIDPDRIDVTVDDGVVTLRGEVGDYLEARYAWDDAWEAAGVRGVINQLTVRTDEPAEEQHGDTLPQTSGEQQASTKRAAGRASKS